MQRLEANGIQIEFAVPPKLVMITLVDSLQNCACRASGPL
jgi:hypothetical protein